MKIKRLIIIFLSFIAILITTCNAIDIENTNATTISEETNSLSNIEELKLYSEAAILIDNKSGEILYSKNATQKMYPASTTKILTAILAIENGNLNDIITVSKTGSSGIPSGYSSAYLSEGEQISVENLLNVLLIHSANEAGNILAEYISGSIEDFVNLMNEKAKELGCTQTNFVNTNGIHNENHYSTAQDLAIIARYCMKNTTFRKIVSTQKCIIPKTNKYDERIYTNTNDLINPNSKYYYEGCIGIKTGYTSQAKNCLISACNKDGLQLIAVVLGAPAIDTGESTRCIDSHTLYNYGYSNYKMTTIITQSTVIDSIEVEKATAKTKQLDLILENDITALTKTNSEANITYEITLNDNISAPILENTTLGTVTYTINNIKYTQNLLASHNVEKSEFLIGILRIILTLIILIFVFIILFKILKKKKRYY